MYTYTQIYTYTFTYLFKYIYISVYRYEISLYIPFITECISVCMCVYIPFYIHNICILEMTTLFLIIKAIEEWSRAHEFKVRMPFTLNKLLILP